MSWDRGAKFLIAGYMAVAAVLIVFAAANHQVYATTIRGGAIYIGLPLVALAAGAFLLTPMARRLRSAAAIIATVALTIAYLHEGYLHWTEAPVASSPVGDLPADAILPVGRGQFGDGVSIGAKVLLPLGGVPRAATTRLTERGTEVFVADRYGFRNDDSVWDQDIDLALVGASLVYGTRPKGRNFSDLLVQAWPMTINLSTGGNGPLMELAALLEYAAGKRPKVVVWFFDGTDLQADLGSELTQPILRRYLDPEFRQDLVAHEAELAAAARERYFALRRASNTTKDASPSGDWVRKAGANPLNRWSALTLQRTRLAVGLLEGGGDWGDPNERLFKEIIQRASVATASWGGLLMVVYLPDWPEIVKKDESKARYREAGLSALRELNLPLLDLREVFRRHQDRRALWANRRSGYYSDEGNALVAREVGHFVTQALR
jgi:hypothetical protein